MAREPVYGPVAKSLHWTTAVAVLGLIAGGLWMVELPIGRQKLVVYAWHKWFGVAVFALAVARLVWRRLRPPPPLPPAVSSWERRLAPWAHGALYAILLAMPVAGWLMSSATGFSVVLFGILPLPDLIERSPEAAVLWKAVHHWLSRVLIVLLALHIGAVLRHDLIRRDGVLRRMLPFAK